jgi:hypothetical protein
LIAIGILQLDVLSGLEQLHLPLRKTGFKLHGLKLSLRRDLCNLKTRTNATTLGAENRKPDTALACKTAREQYNSSDSGMKKKTSVKPRTLESFSILP